MPNQFVFVIRAVLVPDPLLLEVGSQFSKRPPFHPVRVGCHLYRPRRHLHAGFPEAHRSENGANILSCPPAVWKAAGTV